VEQILHRDPAGVYKRMDFATRDSYRQAVEELAEPSGEAQVRVALRAIESALEAQERDPHDDRARHVGCHLMGKGRPKLEVDVAYLPSLRKRAAALFRRHATALYLGSIGALTLLGAVVLAALVEMPQLAPRPTGRVRHNRIGARIQARISLEPIAALRPEQRRIGAALIDVQRRDHRPFSTTDPG
jgi:hypothetical protein